MPQNRHQSAPACCGGKLARGAQDEPAGSCATSIVANGSGSRMFADSVLQGPMTADRGGRLWRHKIEGPKSCQVRPIALTMGKRWQRTKNRAQSGPRDALPRRRDFGGQATIITNGGVVRGCWAHEELWSPSLSPRRVPGGQDAAPTWRAHAQAAKAAVAADWRRTAT